MLNGNAEKIYKISLYIQKFNTFDRNLIVDSEDGLNKTVDL